LTQESNATNILRMNAANPRTLLLTTDAEGPLRVVARFDNDPDPVTGKRRGFTDAPSLVRAGDGSLVCAIPWSVGGTGRLSFHRSTDEGASWTRMDGEWGFLCGKLHRFGGALVFVGIGPKRKDGIRVISSGDHGAKWSAPVSIRSDVPCYSPSAGTVQKDGRLFMAFGAASEEGVFNNAGSRTFIAAADIDRIADPSAWSFSPMVEFPEYPDHFREPGLPNDVHPSHWLEGNVVDTPEGLQAYWRTRIDPYPGAGTLSICMCAVGTIKERDEGIDYTFQNFRPLPGAYNHFHIFFDPTSQLYWLLSNQVGGPLARRNILGLFCSYDAKHWLCAGYPVVFPGNRQAASYVTPLPDGEDLLIVSRTAWASKNNHDNDLVTFHRVPRFRGAAKLLHMETEAPEGAADAPDDWQTAQPVRS